MTTTLCRIVVGRWSLWSAREKGITLSKVLPVLNHTGTKPTQHKINYYKSAATLLRGHGNDKTPQP